MSEMADVANKVVDKFVDAVHAASPAAEFAFNDVIGLIVVAAVSKIIAIVVMSTLVWGLFIWALPRLIKAGTKTECIYGPITVVSGIGCVLSLIFFAHLPGLIARALHPVGHLVLQLL